MNTFAVKDSGKRESFDSGMVRDTEDGKLDYTLVFDGPMLKRWADHLTKGAVKYAARNWMKASGHEEYDRFKRSFLRHMVAYLDGDRDEDHAAGMFFNINGMEYCTERLAGPVARPYPSPEEGCQPQEFDVDPWDVKHRYVPITGVTTPSPLTHQYYPTLGRPGVVRGAGSYAGPAVCCSDPSDCMCDTRPETV